MDHDVRHQAYAPPPSGGHGLVGLFVRHPTAPNLLMATLILVGLFSLLRLNRQFFPNFEIPAITVTVAWPGSSAEDVETNILDVLEPELRFLDGVKEVTSIAREGQAVISMEFDSSADLQKAQSDVEQAVSIVRTLPEESERPVVSRATIFDRVANISISGPFSEKVLKSFAKSIRDGLLNSGIDRVTITGARDEEIWVRVREEQLRRHGLRLQDVATKIRDNTQDLPAGKLEGDVDIQLRAKSERKTPEAIGDIEVKSTTRGDKVFLKDIADIDTRFERDGKIGLSGDGLSIQLAVQRAVSADTIKTMKSMEDYIDKVRPTLPPTLKIKVYDVRGKFVVQRLGILLENGLQGLVLVLAALFIFLNARIAFWVAFGIPVALFAAFGVMYLTGQTINMVSMFALIMMLGIIVDDAIVVGEQAATNEEHGMPSLQAAEQGALKMLAPVSAASLTTMAAFMPIFFISDRIGDIMSAIPLVVLAVLIASLIECFLILPGHLRHGRDRSLRRTSRVRKAIDGAFNAFRDGVFLKFVRMTYRWRYVTVAVLVASFILSIGMVTGGRVGFTFFPSPEPENISASIIFSAGTPREQQRMAVRKIEDALFAAEAKLMREGPDRKRGDSEQSSSADKDGSSSETGSLVVTTFALIGKAQRAQGDNLAQVEAQLKPSEERPFATKRVIAAWRKAVPDIAGVEQISISGRRGGPPGRDVDVRLENGPIEVLKKAAEDVKIALSRFPGLSGIDDDLPYGKQEFIFELTPRATALGFTGASVGAQVRNAFEGAIATRFARGDEEITVRVKRQQENLGRADLDRLYLTTPQGDRVPLKEMVTIRERQNFSIVQRKDGVRTVSVTADVDSDVTTSIEVLDKLGSEVMPGIVERYNIGYSFKGRAEERENSFRDLGQGAMLACALIYIILGWVFGSYWKPLAVMAIIPFGLVGAVVGHYLLGYKLTILSMVGLLGLSGILVNDSIVLVSRIKERLDGGETMEEAAVYGSRDRLRAVLLTSLTTIGGLTPLLFETSRQAQFLMPMAVTIVFGLAAATILVLVLVPSLIGIGSDAGRLGKSAFNLIVGPRPAIAKS